MRAKSGFTLVEILIVVVILGILAAIVIPQFTNASTEAKQSSLQSDLQMLRSQIELYKIQHNDELPGAGVATFEQCMIGWTTVAGAVAAAAGANIYGPYMQKIPTNGFNNNDAIGLDGTPGTGLNGWMYNTTTGVIHPDDTLICGDGVTAHSAL